MIQGQRVRQMRERRALTQTALGAMINKDAAYLSRLESGLLPSVTTVTLARLVTALGVSSDFLLGFTETPTRRPGPRTTPTGLGTGQGEPAPYPMVPEGLTDGTAVPADRDGHVHDHAGHHDHHDGDDHAGHRLEGHAGIQDIQRIQATESNDTVPVPVRTCPRCVLVLERMADARLVCPACRLAWEEEA